MVVGRDVFLVAAVVEAEENVLLVAKVATFEMAEREETGESCRRGTRSGGVVFVISLVVR